MLMVSLFPDTAWMVYSYIKQLDEEKTAVSKNATEHYSGKQPLSKAYRVLGRVV